MDNLDNIIDDLTDHITVLKELGQRTIEMDPQIVRDITAAPPSTTQPVAPPTKTAKRSIPKKHEPLTKAVLQSTPPLSPAERIEALRELEHDMRHCFECSLSKIRRKPLAGQGNSNSPDIMFIGAVPDVEDEKTGQVFSGAAGELLTKMIEAMGYKRDNLFLTNICKCRPEKEGAPLPQEMMVCTSFLEKQIKIIRPKTIVLLGEHAIRGLFMNQSGATRPQGAWTQYHGIPVMPTFHPKYILRFRNDAEGQQRKLKSSVWRALKAVMQLLKH